MKRVYAKGCRMHRLAEGLEGLAISRGRVTDQQLSTHASSWVETYPQEAPSAV
jgi:hypothetical protein